MKQRQIRITGHESNGTTGPLHRAPGWGTGLVCLYHTEESFSQCEVVRRGESFYMVSAFFLDSLGYSKAHMSLATGVFLTLQ